MQNLIPNGTKVDISTMLEEAVHYVKFLQLQIKVVPNSRILVSILGGIRHFYLSYNCTIFCNLQLLSSDDMWMYAPIVYNGLDIGQFGKIFPTL